ncbi:MAG TPA: mechanosensitive ion channel [Alcaligenes sp.]|nr:mechanosensitive ion channel [Alcaligenes sp.]
MTVLRGVWLVLCLCLWTAFAAQAQPVLDGPADRELKLSLQQAQDTVRLVQLRLDDTRGLRVADISQQDSNLDEVLGIAVRAVRQLEQRSRFLQARLQELGQENAGEIEPEQVRAERDQLRRAEAAVRADLKLARLVQVEADQARQLLKDTGRRLENEKRWQRVPSLLFLEGVPLLRQTWLSDKEQWVGYWQEWRASWHQSWHQGDGSLWLALAALLAGSAMLKVLPGLVARFVPGGRLRRSALAMGNLLVWLGMVWVLGKELVQIALDRPGLSERQYALLAYGQFAALTGALVLAVMQAVLFQPRSSWRLLPVSDRGQARLRFFPYLFLVLVYIEFLAEAFKEVLSLSDIFVQSLEGVVTTLYLLLFAYALWGVRAERFLAPAGQEPEPGERAYSWARLAYYGAIAVYTLALLTFLGGWQGLADDLISHFMSMALLFGLLGYLLMVLLQDMGDSLLAHVQARQRDADSGQSRAQSQLIVVLFAAARLSVLALTVWVISSDWLNAPKQMLESGLDVSREVLRLGAVQWRLDLWLIALGVLLVGVLFIRMLRIWLRRRFMPNTTLEPGLQNAIVASLSYAAYFVLVVVCLSMLGVPIESVTWIFTALTVGVGFGLRGLVQNFASGLILMLERPVKVGDWVEVDGSEGNVREIRMRATYVERFDRSMLMVPNADMVGRQVRNLTYTPASLGAVETRLILPLDVDADLVMELLQQAVAEQTEILADPPAQLFCDGIQGDGLAFGMRCFLASMRQQRRVRSKLMLDVLRRLRAHGISLHPAQRWLHTVQDPDGQ